MDFKEALKNPKKIIFSLHLLVKGEAGGIESLCRDYEQLGSAYIEEDYGVGKDKYVFSSVFPNEEIMRKVDAIMTEGER